LAPGFQISDPGSGSGMGKKSGSGSGDLGWKTRIIFLRAEKTIFLINILKFFDADPGSRIQIEKIWIRDPGSR
jgi:hypothetical protein